MKYWASASEDHTKVRYNGIEGYCRFADKARPFGYLELKNALQRHFSSLEYYFPFPDYKVPEAVISEAPLALINAAPLLGSVNSRDYLRPFAPRLNEKLTWPGLVANQQLAFFANSFLVVASKRELACPIKLGDLAILYNRSRAEEIYTITRLYWDDSGEIVIVEKSLLNPVESSEYDFQPNGYTETWYDRQTIHQ